MAKPRPKCRWRDRDSVVITECGRVARYRENGLAYCYHHLPSTIRAREENKFRQLAKEQARRDLDRNLLNLSKQLWRSADRLVGESSLCVEQAADSDTQEFVDAVLKYRGFIREFDRVCKNATATDAPE